MYTYVELTPKEIDTVDHEFYEVCSEIFDLVDSKRVNGVDINIMSVDYNKIYADIYNRKKARKWGESPFDNKLVATRDEDGVISKGSKITLDNEVDFINGYYSIDLKSSLEKEIDYFIDNLYMPLFTNSELLDPDNFKKFSSSLKRYERLRLTREEREFIDSRFFGICEGIFDALDNSTAYNAVRIGDFYAGNNVIEEKRDCIITEFDWAGDPWYEDAYTWFKFAERKRSGKIVAGDDMTVKEKITFIYNYENWGLKERIYNKVNEDIINNTTVSYSNVEKIKKLLKK